MHQRQAGRPSRQWVGVLVATGFAAVVVAAVSSVLGAAPGTREWRDYAGGPDSSRFVAASQITKANVGQLQVAWTFPDGDTDFNPLVVRDTIYTRARGNTIVAVDAATGTQRWASPEIKAFVIRGINYWESPDGKDRRLFVSTLNRLQAFDASNGQRITSFGRDGAVDLREGLDRDPEKVQQQSRLPGKIFGNLIILGSATNTEYTSAPGDIRAFDVRTGAHVWSFRTIPRKGEFGADTWPENARATVGGANAWAEMSVDPVRGIVYVPTGSGKYNFFGGYRRGDNLFSDSLIALDAKTGARKWHFQTVHHDIWDLDNNSAPQLTTITHEGRKVDIVAMASKTGYLYVFDRATGKPIWPIEERPVPQKTTVPGQYLSPTQPFPTRPEPFARQSFTVDDLNPYILTDEQRARFRERILKARNDGPFTPIGFDEVIHMPGNQGGSNWGSTAGNPHDGRVYVIGFNVPTIIRLQKAGEKRAARAGGNPAQIVEEGYPTTDGFGLYPTLVEPPYTTLTAYDLNKGAIAWQKGLGDDLRLLPLGITGTGSAATVKGGLIVTGTGLVFATAADRKVHVYDTGNGTELATLPLGGPTSGGPSMYEHNGRQYLLVTASAVQPSGPGAVPTPHTGPTGLVAYALPK